MAEIADIKGYSAIGIDPTRARVANVGGITAMGTEQTRSRVTGIAAYLILSPASPPRPPIVNVIESKI